MLTITDWCYRKMKQEKLTYVLSDISQNFIFFASINKSFGSQNKRIIVYI